MKRNIIITMLAVSLTATSTFGQGWLYLLSARSQVWDGFTTPGIATVSSHVNVALFWAPGANVANPMPLASSPINSDSGFGTASLWSDLFTSSFTLTQDASSGNNDVIVTTTTRGIVVYAPVGGGSIAGASWSINGSTADETITLLEVGWNSAYATPQMAASAGAAIGWSYLNSFTLAAAPTDTGNNTPAFTPFGIFVPEPATLALVGLGGLSLLVFRRRK